MAALEYNGQGGFSPTENGDAVAGSKSVSIDYSEDLWLANSEDSVGPYAQQPSKVMTHDEPYSYPSRLEVGYSNSSSARDPTASPGSVTETTSEFSEPQVVTGQGQVWNEVTPGSEAMTLQPATSYINGLEEQGGLDFNSSGEEKDFAQLVPAGSYVESGGVAAAVDSQDKTFTSLMPAAVMDMNGDVQAEYGTIIDAPQRQISYYSSAEQANGDSQSPAVVEDVGRPYEHSVQVAAVNDEREESGEREGNGTVYISMEGLNPAAQNMSQPGNFAVLSPALIRMGNASVDSQAYSSHATGSGYQHISTLPFVQNGTYSTVTSFHTSPVSTIINSGDNQHVLQHSDFGSDPNGFSCDSTALAACTMLAPTLHSVEYQEDDDDDDDDDEDLDDQDLEDDSLEYSHLRCPVCSETFVDQSTLDEHMANHPAMKSFVCDTCGKGFATRRYLKYHRKNHCKRAGSYEGRNDIDENDPTGELKRFCCNVCHRPFRVLKCMKVHKKKKHGIQKEYTCPSCAVTFTTSQGLTDHSCESRSVPAVPQVIQYTPPPLILPSQKKKKKKLKNAKPACDICGKTFSDRISVDIHRVKHIEEEFYPCDMCTEDADADSGHLAVHFRIRFFTDDNQHILEDQKAAVANHDQSKSDDGSSVSATPVHPGSAEPQSTPATPIYHPATPTNLPGTPASSGHNSSMVDCAADESLQLLERPPEETLGLNQALSAQSYAEVKVTADDRTVTLSNFKTIHNNSLLISGQSSLMNHQENESLQLQQQTYSANLENSEVIHDAAGSVLAVAPKKKKFKKSKVHTCDICNKSFGDTAKLGLHYKSNHLHDRPYQCDVCDKSFFTKWKLQRHMLSHLEQKPHSCPMCSKSFVERGKLEAHYRTHLGTKPYKCDQCPKAFTVKSQLSIHQRRIHSTDQPFGCLVCGKAFLWKSGLDKHMRKHTREKPYKCESCGVKYSNKANLIVHMSKVHNQTYVDK